MVLGQLYRQCQHIRHRIKKRAKGIIRLKMLDTVGSHTRKLGHTAGTARMMPVRSTRLVLVSGTALTVTARHIVLQAENLLMMMMG